MTDTVKMPKPIGTICFDDGRWGQNWISSQDAYSEEQLKQYGYDRAREALKMAVKVVEADLWPGPVHDYQYDYNDGVKSLANKVRALAKEIK